MIALVRRALLTTNNLAAEASRRLLDAPGALEWVVDVPEHLSVDLRHLEHELFANTGRRCGAVRTAALELSVRAAVRPARSPQLVDHRGLTSGVALWYHEPEATWCVGAARVPVGGCVRVDGSTLLLLETP